MKSWRDLMGEMDEPSEDRTVTIRETPDGPRIDSEYVERTDFSNGIPQTVKEVHLKGPLSCGHVVTRERPFGGYCQGRVGILNRHICNQPYCKECALSCPACGRTVSLGCCAAAIDGVMYCKPCARRFIAGQIGLGALSVALYPFFAPEAGNDDAADE